MTRRFLMWTVTTAAATAALLGAGQASAATLKVCRSGCPYAQLAPAVGAAERGDTVKIGPGTYAGGLTIDVSVKLVGTGPDSTIISGGGPVLAIGVADAASEPTVTIDGVTVTGGVTTGNLTPFSGRGGGIYIPRAAGPSTGAAVTIRNSVIRGNRVAPRVATDSGDPCCPFADAGGGGISNDGTLTLDQTVVSNNRADAASGLTSDAVGGGILNRAFGTLTLKHSVVRGNRASVTAPNGRLADGGGILMVAGELTMKDSLLRDNHARVSTAFAGDVETFAQSGGLHSEGGASATIRNTSISGNSASASNSLGSAVAFCGGVCTDGALDVRGATVADNRVRAGTPAADAFADSGGFGLGCCQDEPFDVTIADTKVIGNRVTAAAPTGLANASGGGVSAAGTPAPTLNGDAINGNQVTATSTTGTVVVHGVGINNGGLLTVRDTSVSNNSGTAGGPAGEAQGAGIWNGPFGPPPPAPDLTLFSSRITGNTLNAAPGVSVAGGGLFTSAPVTLDDTVLRQNAPDQCVGC